MADLLAAAAGGGTYAWLKFVHLLGMVVYVGGFLTLTRMLGHAVRFEAPQSRADAYRVLKRMHVFVDWGGLALMMIAGLWLLVADPVGKQYMKQGYFHMKMTFIVVLLVSDAILSRKLFRMRGEDTPPAATMFRVVHGIAGLALIGILIAIFVLR